MVNHIDLAQSTKEETVTTMTIVDQEEEVAIEEEEIDAEEEEEIDAEEEVVTDVVAEEVIEKRDSQRTQQKLRKY